MSANRKLILRLQIGAQLSPLLDRDALIKSSLIQGLETELTECVDALGIPGTWESEVAVDKTQSEPVHWLVDGQECHYPEVLPATALAFVRGEVVGSSIGKEENIGWADHLRAMALEGQITTERLIQFFRVFLRAVIEQRPSILLGRMQTQTYAATLEEAGFHERVNQTEEWIGRVLAEVLDMGLGLADAKKVAAILRESDARRTPRDRVEDLIAGLTSETIDIRARREFIKRFSLGHIEGKGLIPMLRDGLFYELGVRYPGFRFVASDQLPQRGFEFKIHNWVTLPRIGLAPDELLVNDTVDRLKRLKIDAKPAVNPANNIECSIINSRHRANAENARLTTWDEHGYMILCLAAELRCRSGRFVSTRSVDTDLELLAAAFPELVTSVRGKLGVEQITRVLRRLVSEEISIRNLRRILERLLEFDYIHCDSPNLIIFDDRMPTSRAADTNWIQDPDTLANFVRMGLKEYISHQATRGQNTMSAFLVDSTIERQLTRSAALPQTESERLLKAIGKELGNIPPSGQLPALLTTIEIRSALRRLIEGRFPRLRVLCYQELSPAMNIQPVGRISLS